MPEIDSYNDWERYAEANGYEPDFYDEEEESYKRDTLCSGYALHVETGTYALVTWTSNYDHGSSNFEIQKRGLTKHVRTVTRTETVYE